MTTGNETSEYERTAVVLLITLSFLHGQASINISVRDINRLLNTFLTEKQQILHNNVDLFYMSGPSLFLITLFLMTAEERITMKNLGDSKGKDMNMPYE